MAVSYQIGVEPIDNSILSNESATFKLTITNFERTSQRFQIYTLDPNWVVRVEPPLSTVEPSSVQEHTLVIRPTSSISYGSEGMTVLVKHLDSGVIQKENLVIHVEDPNRQPGQFVPSVKLDLEKPAEIDPRQPFKIGVNLRNRNGLDIKNMTLEINSPLFEKSMQLDLEPTGEKTLEFSFNLDPRQVSGEYNLNTKLLLDGKQVNEVKSSFTIATIKDMVENVADKDLFFRSETQVKVTNKGNGEDTHQIKLKTSLFRSIFSSTEPKVSTEKIGGERYYVWNVTLTPAESTTVTRVENYRLLIIILIIVFIAVLLYYLMRSPVIAVKETISLSDNGEKSNLKVRIFIKNRTGKQLDAVSVIDRIPSIASYVPKETLGMVSPTKVVKTEKKGVMLKWELDILEPYEERILSYTLVSKLKIIGKLRLPNGKVHFNSKSGKERVTFTKNISYEE